MANNLETTWRAVGNVQVKTEVVGRWTDAANGFREEHGKIPGEVFQLHSNGEDDDTGEGIEVVGACESCDVPLSDKCDYSYDSEDGLFFCRDCCKGLSS